MDSHYSHKKLSISISKPQIPEVSKVFRHAPYVESQEEIKPAKRPSILQSLSKGMDSDISASKESLDQYSNLNKTGDNRESNK